MGNLVELFVERLVDNGWREERPLRTPMEMDFVEVLRKKRSLMKRGMPHDVSPELEEALGDLGDGELENISWATLAELRKLPFEEVITERRLFGPILWRERRERGSAAPLRGSHVDDDGTPALLERFGARLVSNEHMDRLRRERRIRQRNPRPNRRRVQTLHDSRGLAIPRQRGRIRAGAPRDARARLSRRGAHRLGDRPMMRSSRRCGSAATAFM